MMTAGGPSLEGAFLCASSGKPTHSTACLWLKRDFPATEPTVSLTDLQPGERSEQLQHSMSSQEADKQAGTEADGRRGLEKLSFKNCS